MTLGEPGSYRVFADFKRRGPDQTLATDLTVDGPPTSSRCPPPATTATTEAATRSA